MADRTASSSPMPATALLDALGHSMSDKRIEVLRHLVHNGSISQSARDCGISYKAAWQALDTLTNLAGVTLVERSVGGAGGGGATLTEAGHALLQAADAMERARSEVLARLQGAGLHQPVLARLAVRTSMRNQWPCTVQSLHTEGGRVTVLLHTDSRHAAPLRAQVTRESAELMGLVPGQAVLAMAKATAVQVLSGAAAADGLQATVWDGEVTRADTGEGAEVAVRLPGGVHVVGFAVGAPLQPGAQVQVRIPAAAVVLALVDGAGLAGP
ncbi:TOBE domain-containing protein [Comamonas terrigena]|uniref:TOBE domain-containing protein n=1 Tax=Comamonas terrigena TaxID=32013 RepID=UPI00244975E2|nr:TOBE domain-containing protein [Comamonas terrigena]MDH0049986.1 LysR family transcriptional regulator [Comamonas terrigena]MDH0513403.1 LysR family transcriptional regulator [Comamonas terrigena]MDH1092803.1 LysR family transcriptional regulator [Comamonas terrigena]MDH1502831.1 LysR family transcriptional regulator [Comamonas terrigena]